MSKSWADSFGDCLRCLCKSMLVVTVFFSPVAVAAECVILLHGLARTSASLDKIAVQLAQQDYVVVNIDYPSRDYVISELAPLAVEAGLSQCREQETRRINFVTHSLGGILVRAYIDEHQIAGLHRVVMLAPPNQGSAVADVFSQLPGYRWLNGPAGMQLGTGVNSIPLQLGAVDFDLGIIAGNRTINVILSQFLDNPDDGKVSVASTRVEGMCGFIEMPVTHAMMMRNDDVIAQVLQYLSEGRFAGVNAEIDLCDRENR